MPFFQAPDGCRLFYEVQGWDCPDHPVVVFLNGFSQTTLYWAHQAGGFRDAFRVLRYDARSQGKSDIGNRPLTLEIHLDDLAGLLDHLKVASAHLIGLSHGANVALAFATGRADQTASIVLCGLGAGPADGARAVGARWLQVLEEKGMDGFAREVLPDVLGASYLDYTPRMADGMVNAFVRRNSQAALETMLRAILGYPPVQCLAAGLCRPALVVAGSQDTLVSTEGARELAAICRAEYCEISQAGHSMPIEAPEAFGTIVVQFLNRLAKRKSDAGLSGNSVPRNAD